MTIAEAFAAGFPLSFRGSVRWPRLYNMELLGCISSPAPPPISPPRSSGPGIVLRSWRAWAATRRRIRSKIPAFNELRIADGYLSRRNNAARATRRRAGGSSCDPGELNGNRR